MLSEIQGGPVWLIREKVQSWTNAALSAAGQEKKGGSGRGSWATVISSKGKEAHVQILVMYKGH